uniref:Ig-like domain-containing protein n=1 Tax=Amphilophus citrinellus TaxID=61819 RepID=A0A3Q0S249_AMPCI
MLRNEPVFPQHFVNCCEHGRRSTQTWENTLPFLCCKYVLGSKPNYCSICVQHRGKHRQRLEQDDKYALSITAVPGQDVTLTCRAPNSDPITAVKWSRTDVEPEYDVFYLNEQSLQEYRHPSSASRVDLQDRQMKDGDASVILKNVTINDAGTYECRIVQGGANRWKRANLDIYPFSILYLSVADAPGDCTLTFNLSALCCFLFQSRKPSQLSLDRTSL